MAIFFNTLGGAISISVAQNIFSNTLATELLQRTSGIDPLTIIRAGATRVRDVTPPDQLRAVLESYNEAIQRCFVLPIAVGGLALICSLFVSTPPLPPEVSRTKTDSCDLGRVEKREGQEIARCRWCVIMGQVE